MINPLACLSAAVKRNSAAWFVSALMLLAFSGCGGVQAGTPSEILAAPAPGSTASRAAPPESASRREVTGVWQGSSRARCTNFNPMAINTRCNAINRITLTMVQKGHKITGFYTCSVGNIDCRNQNDSGKIASGKILNGRLQLRIMMSNDNSSCLFFGAKVRPNVLAGPYSCYQGGGLIEQGNYAVQRNY